jgi:membrane-bound ClpP family serine protease
MVEFFIIPGITIAGIGALLLVGGGVFCGYYFHGATIGSYILLGSGIGMIIFFTFALRKRTWQRFGLKSEIEGKVSIIQEDAIKVGDSGKTVSRLAPIGKAMINDTLYEVRSEGGYLDANKEVTVIQIDVNKIYVELK